MVEKIILEATIPTVQYGNVKPTIELEGESFEEIRDRGLSRMKSISDMVAGEGYTFEVRGLDVSQGMTQTNTVLKTNELKTSDLTGVSVFYDPDAHQYVDSAGNKYLSGSKFPERFYSEFNSQLILDKLVQKYPGISALDIAKMWKLNGQVSTSFGTSIHAALENYDKFSSIGAVLAGEERNRALSKNSFLRNIVERFHLGRGEEDVLSECFVANEEYKIAGTIDRLKFVDKANKVVRIQDYKTDGDINEKKYQVKDSPFKGVVPNTLLGYHVLQLSFYAFILKKAGYTVEGLDILWLNPDKIMSDENPWEEYSFDVVDIEKSLSKEQAA